LVLLLSFHFAELIRWKYSYRDGNNQLKLNVVRVAEAKRGGGRSGEVVRLNLHRRSSPSRSRRFQIQTTVAVDIQQVETHVCWKVATNVPMPVIECNF